MSSSLTESILELPLFAADGNSGYPIGAMLLASNGLRKIPKEELLAALSAMERSGLLRCEKQAYFPTRDGRVALRRLLVQQGLTMLPLANQMHYELADLILAIGVHEQIEHGVQASFLTREVISIYLYEFDAREVATAVDRLIQAGHLRQYEFAYRDCVVITGERLQHYQQDVCQRLNLEPEHGILRLVRAPRNGWPICAARA